MLAQTPPMGWNSWNTFGQDISEELIHGIADAMVETGLRDAGYNYVVIDDCWSEKQRDKNGRLRPDAVKFPGGMKAVGDYVHSKGLKFGMYSCAGTRTCADYPGSFEYEFIDAETFAEWGVDYLKYDYCYRPKHMEGQLLYKRMAMALRSCGREILLSACNWGADGAETFMRSSGAHIWRSTGDIFDKWDSIKNITYQQVNLAPYGAPGCYNDMDMLVVGMGGRGNVGLGGCTDEEYRTHFSIWSLLCSPLMIGCDIRNMSEAIKKILTNSEIVALNQDPEGRQPWFAVNECDHLVAVRPLAGGDYAIGFFNMADDSASIYLSFWDLGLPTSSGYAIRLRDLWRHEDAGIYKEGFRVKLDGHACAVYRAKIVKG